MRHTISLKSLMDNIYVPTDDWRAVEYDGLDDLDFELTGINSMSFEYNEVRGGEKKQLFIEVKKKKGGNWTVKVSRGRDGKNVIKEFKTYADMLKFVHDIFNKS